MSTILICISQLSYLCLMRIYPLNDQLLNSLANLLYLEILNKYVFHGVCSLHIIQVQVLVMSKSVVDIIVEFVKDVDS